MNRDIDPVLFVTQPPTELLELGEVIGYQDFNDLAAGWSASKEIRLFHQVLEYFGQNDPELKEVVAQIRNNPQDVATRDRNPVSKQLYIRTQELFDLVEMLSNGQKVSGLGPKSLLTLKEVLGIDDPGIVPRIPADEYYKSLGKFVRSAVDNILANSQAVSSQIAHD